MRARTWLGAWVIGLCVASATGCADPPSHGHRNPSKPVATARVTSSALTKKITGVKAWRIYEGKTQVVVMGFDAKGAPIDGIRFRYAAKNDARPWAVSIESLRHGGVLQLGKDGKPTKRTMSDEGVKTLVGASRVLDAWTRKRSGVAIAAKSLQSIAATAGECGDAAVGAVKDCAPVVSQCARWGYRGWQRGRHWGAAGATLVCLAYNWRQTGQCAGSAYGAGRTCYDAYQGRASSEEDRNGEATAKDGDTSLDGDPSRDGEPESSDELGTPPDLDGSHEDPATDGDPEWNGELENAAEDDSAWQADESQAEAEAAAEDPEAPLEEQVEDGGSYADESYGDEYDANPSDPEEEAISEDSGEDWSESSDDSSGEYASEDEGSYDESSDDSSYEDSSGDVEAESFMPLLLPKTASKSARTASSRTRAGACAPSRVLHCGSRATAAFCRCVK